MTGTQGRGVRPTTSAGARLRQRSLQMLILLLVEFALGIATNLYIKVPARHPGAHAGAYFSGAIQGIGWAVPNGAITLAAHVALGLALIVVAVDVLVRSIVTRSLPRRAGVIWASVVGVAAIIGAGFNGVSFLNYGHNVSSLIMALLFALAVASYVVDLYLIPQPRPDTG